MNGVAAMAADPPHMMRPAAASAHTLRMTYPLYALIRVLPEVRRLERSKNRTRGSRRNHTDCATTPVCASARCDRLDHRAVDDLGVYASHRWCDVSFGFLLIRTP